MEEKNKKKSVTIIHENEAENTQNKSAVLSDPVSSGSEGS